MSRAPETLSFPVDFVAMLDGDTGYLYAAAGEAPGPEAAHQPSDVPPLTDH